MDRHHRSAATAELTTYLRELQGVPRIDRRSEGELARRYRATGDTRAAGQLIVANLESVVAIALEYRRCGMRLEDLVQEGNLGLLRAVQKFEPDREVRLLTYAAWWIRAYIKSYILANWSFVRLGTTQAQRRLFFSLERARRSVRDASGEAVADPDAVATRLGMARAQVESLEERINARDVSLNAPLADGETEGLELVRCPRPGPDEQVADAEARAVFAREVQRALAALDSRERRIVEHRLLADEPLAFQDIGAELGISRERTRQLDLRARTKLLTALEASLSQDPRWANAAAPTGNDTRRPLAAGSAPVARASNSREWSSPRARQASRAHVQAQPSDRTRGERGIP